MTLFINALRLDTRNRLGDGTACRYLVNSLLSSLWPQGNSEVIWEVTGERTRLNHLDSFTQFCKRKSPRPPESQPANAPDSYKPAITFFNRTWFCPPPPLPELFSRILLWAFSPLKDAGSNIGVRVSLGDNRGLQFPDHIQLHHSYAELQKHRERAGRGKAVLSACMMDGW